MQDFSADKSQRKGTLLKLGFLLIILILVSMSFVESGIHISRYSYNPLGAAADESQALRHANFPVGNAAFFMNHLDGAPGEKRTLTFRQSDYGFYALSPWQQHFAPEMEDLYKLRSLTEISTALAEMNISYIATPNYMPVTLYNSLFAELISDPEYTDHIYLSSHGYKVFALPPIKRDIKCAPLQLPEKTIVQSPKMYGVELVSTQSLLGKPLVNGPLPFRHSQTILNDAEVEFRLRLSLPDDTPIRDDMGSRGLIIEAQINGTPHLRGGLTQLDWLESHLSVTQNWDSIKRTRSHLLSFQSLVSPEAQSAEIVLHASGIDRDFTIEGVKACIFSKPYTSVQSSFGIGVSDVLDQFPLGPTRTVDQNEYQQELTWSLQTMSGAVARQFVTGNYYPTLWPSFLSFTLSDAPSTPSSSISVSSLDRQDRCRKTDKDAFALLFSGEGMSTQSGYAQLVEYLFWLYHYALSIDFTQPPNTLSTRLTDFVFGKQEQYLFHMNASGTGRVTLYANWLDTDGKPRIRTLRSSILSENTSSRSSMAILPANATNLSLMASVALPLNCDTEDDGLLFEITDLSLYKLGQTTVTR